MTTPLAWPNEVDHLGWVQTAIQPCQILHWATAAILRVVLLFSSPGHPEIQIPKLNEYGLTLFQRLGHWLPGLGWI